MNTNDKITANGVTYRVLGKIGAGGQGAVWKVENCTDSNVYALKIIEEKDVNRRMNKVANIRRLVNEKVDKRLAEAVAKGEEKGIEHACPIACYVDPATHATGYIMELASGKTLNRMLIDGMIEKMPVKDKLKLLKKIAASIDVLHSIGYCYTDINWGNFMWNDATDTLYVIDCENMACSSDIANGTCSFLIGTAFFIAPEVAFGKAKAGFNSDKYALATLIFRVLTNNVLESAYHGVAMYSVNPRCQTMLEVADLDDEGDIDPNWRKFVFDPNDKSNGLDNLCKNSKNSENIKFRKRVESVIAIWATLDNRLKQLFYEAFTDPFAWQKRPLGSKWVKTINEILHSKPVKSVVGSGASPKSPAQTKQAAAVAVGQQPQPIVTPKPTGRTGKKYPAFVPAGHGVSPIAPAAQPATTLPDKPYLISTAGLAVAITADDFVVEGAPLGLKQNVIGHIKKTDNGYLFVSQLLSVVEILDGNGKTKETLHKGQETAIASGESIKPVVSSVAIKLEY